MEYGEARRNRINAPDWKKQLSKELLGARRVHFPRRQVHSTGVNEIWTGDLLDMQRYSRENKGYHFILVVLDVFSRYAFARPIKRKTGPETAAALESIFTETKTSPQRFWGDEGNESLNRDV